MKALGIVGYKKSGKTTLIGRLSQELSKKGHRVAVIKHVPGNIDFPDTDTSRLKSHAQVVCAVSSAEAEIILKGPRGFEDMLKYLECDILLVEGFKKEKTFPKVICLKDKSEQKELSTGLELFTASFSPGISDFNISKEDNIKEMATLVEERSFKLPNLNCGHCGYETCFGLAKEIVKGKENVDKCVSLHPLVSVKVDGEQIPLNPFMSNLFKDTTLAMLQSLKGFKKGKVEIKIP